MSWNQKKNTSTQWVNRNFTTPKPYFGVDMNPAARPMTLSFTPPLPPADLDGPELTTAATTEEPGQELQVVLAELSEQELVQLREQNPELARELEAAQALAQNPELAQPQDPAANRWAFSGAGSASTRASGTTFLLMLVPVVKNATGSYALAYGGAAIAGQSVGAILSKILPQGSQEYAVAPEHAGSLRQAKVAVMMGAYLGSLAAGNELPKYLSGAALGGTGFAVAAAVGQVVQHGPFIVQQLAGHEVSERNLARPGRAAILMNLVISGTVGVFAGSEIDIANAVKAPMPNSTFDGAAGVAATYVPIFLAVTTFAVLATYAPQLIQSILAARAQNNRPSAPPEDLEAGGGGVQPPVVELPPHQAATHQDGTPPAPRREQDVSIV